MGSTEKCANNRAVGSVYNLYEGVTVPSALCGQRHGVKEVPREEK